MGEVTAVNPLEIKVDNYLPLPEEVLFLTKNTTDWTMEMTVDHNTTTVGGGGGYAEFAPHKHGYKGRKKYLVHNSLKVGDQVLLLRAKGGQKFIVLDRVFNPEKGCSD